MSIQDMSIQDKEFLSLSSSCYDLFQIDADLGVISSE